MSSRKNGDDRELPREAEGSHSAWGTTASVLVAERVERTCQQEPQEIPPNCTFPWTEKSRDDD